MSDAANESDANKPLRVVFDTGIVLAAAFNPSGVAMKTLRLMETGEIEVFVSNRLRHEYEALLRHPAHGSRYVFMTEDYVNIELDRFDTYAERIPNPPSAFTYKRDANDEPLINLVVAIKAHYLVTLDNDLLALPKHPEFVALRHKPQVLRPGGFLTEIERRRA
jgi:putative PIN family toxin of toxin-antitoxin system